MLVSCKKETLNPVSRNRDLYLSITKAPDADTCSGRFILINNISQDTIVNISFIDNYHCDLTFPEKTKLSYSIIPDSVSGLNKPLINISLDQGTQQIITYDLNFIIYF